MSETLPTATVSPKASTLPPIPAGDPLTPPQWKTLLAIAETIIPTVKPASIARSRTEIAVTDNEYSAHISKLRGLTPEPNGDEAAKALLDDNPASDPVFREELRRVIALTLPQSNKKDLSMILNILNTRAGSLVLTGKVTPFSEQPIHVRETILQSWATARLPLLRQLVRSMGALSKQTWLKTSETLPRFLGYPRVPIGMIPGKGFDYEFIQFPPGEKPEVIETDVVIVGSGCGGGVCAKNLAEAGHRVIVVEKAHHWTPEHFPMRDQYGWNNLFMHGGGIQSDDSTLAVVAGQTFGGGGTVNWSASLQTQAYVRKEWADRGLPFFTSAEFQDSLDRVCQRMGVSTDYIEHSNINRLLLEGARKLGYSAKAVPQNSGGKRHYCGQCTFGCGSCEKQGPVVSWLPDAARAGAKFVEGFHAEKIIFAKRGGQQVATGVKGTWVSRDINGGIAGEPVTRRKVIIKAKRVIISAGTMQSPLLLLRSGLKNHHIGRNLYLHPVIFLGGIYNEDIVPWEGDCLTSVVNEFENLDGRGHGVKIEATNMTPSAWLTFMSWKGGLDYKLNAARMRHMAGYFAIAREKHPGQVYPDPHDGRVRVKYTTSNFDKAHLLEGIIALAKIQYVQGATEIFPMIPGHNSFVRDPATPTSEGVNDPKFQDWLSGLRAKGLPSPETMYVSAHQMGTSRMSAKEKEGVVDPTGLVWGTKGLYVADASVFPSASGVNPMITNMAISDWISRGIAKGLAERPKL
ncbi:long chain fatty alcohol oxidase [Paraphaeosphaeria sporulosa]|uniref:Long-chain-alcohol oxidase n=1 Tax=Paraphaeosphaeria sporulosa TaxID=1460663 RepID=A0A177CAQ1_9PLEO|nr:long chain fatty alcohol oxidase [Paraphaeosphaeria sporulosa]OAG03790.1 long chain fatty alcohol oxidase [Paraphaeosphaeria sporulosa]